LQQSIEIVTIPAVKRATKERAIKSLKVGLKKKLITFAG
jgi:hypothetical protein